MSGSDTDRTTYWYYRTADGHETGPVLMSRLRQLARKGQLFADDQVRKGRMGDWVEAATIEGLPVRVRPTRPTPARVPSPAAQAQSEPTEAHSPGIWQSLVYWYYDTVQAVLDRLWLIRRAGVIAALVLMTAIAGRLILSLDLWSFAGAGADPYETFRALGTEIREKRESNAPDAAWQELSERGRRTIQPLVAMLERQASSTNRVGQMLLWAGRDCLPKMFDDARQESSAAEQAFDEYMRNVEMLRRNEPIYGGNAGATHFHDRRAAAAGPWYAIDPGTALLWRGMLLVDVAVVVWLFRKWRQSAT